jgi:hypothetical protein
VFIKAGGVVPTRTDIVPNNDQNPLTEVTLNVSVGAPGSYTLYEDSGATVRRQQSATTTVQYRETGTRHTVTINPTVGYFPGQVKTRQWTISLLGVTTPTAVAADGAPLPTNAYHWDATTRILTVTLPQRDVRTPIIVTYQPPRSP